MAKRIIGKTVAEISEDIKKAISDSPRIAGVEAVKFFQQSFRNQAWSEKWDARKKDKDPGRAILVKTGRLRRAIKILRINTESVTVGVDLSEVPYAQVHNEGFKGTVQVGAYMRRNKTGDTYNAKTRRISSAGVTGVKAHTMNMNTPERRYVGSAAILIGNIKRQLVRRLQMAVR